METFSTDIRAILQELNQSECQADELISVKLMKLQLHFFEIWYIFD